MTFDERNMMAQVVELVKHLGRAIKKVKADSEGLLVDGVNGRSIYFTPNGSVMNIVSWKAFENDGAEIRGEAGNVRMIPGWEPAVKAALKDVFLKKEAKVRMADDELLAALRDMGVRGLSTVAGPEDIRWQAVFLIGPAGAGKSWFRSKTYLKYMNFKLVDPDEVKKRHPNYDPEKPYKLHEWSKNVSDGEFWDIINDGSGSPVVVDGTGRDAESIILKAALAKASGYRIFLVYVWVPVEVALWRNRNRERFVPERKLMDAYKEIERSFGKLRGHVDKYKVVPNFTNKDLEEAKKDLAIYPAPQASRPPRPGASDYSEMDLAASEGFRRTRRARAENLAMAMVRKGTSVSEAVIVATTACDRCMKVLACECGLEWGSEAGEDSGTGCNFCREMV
jgi:predicted ABC-type ATPase